MIFTIAGTISYSLLKAEVEGVLQGVDMTNVEQVILQIEVSKL